jgi:Spy/CpxP family protein refolding chaperone
MTRRYRYIGLAALTGILGAVSIAAAQAPAPTPEAASPPPHQGVNMDGHGMMMRGVDPAQMRQMIEGCNRMMGAMAHKDPGPGKPAPAPNAERKPNG